MFDSTLQIPTVCGVPTLKSVQFVNKKGAIAFDSCNNRFYTYNPKTQIWSQVTGGGTTIDTTSLSNRIDARVKYTDTSAMLLPYRKIDSLRRSSDSVYALKNGTWRFQYRDSVGGGTGSDTAKVVVANVTNAEANTLQRGEVVYLYQATGNRASVKRARNTSDSTSAKTFGIVRDPIPAGNSGIVTTQGQCDKLNLGSYADGTSLWVDSISGQLTPTKPQAPYHSVYVGIVERGNNGNGILYVKPQNGVELDEIHDVQITSIANNNTILWNDTTKVWRNRPYNLQTLLNAGNIANNSGISLNDGTNFSSWANNAGNGPQLTFMKSGSYTNVLYPEFHTFYNNSFGNTKASTITMGYDGTLAQYVTSWSRLNASNVTLSKRLLPRYSVNQTASHNYYLPDISGSTERNLAVSVNGNFADNFGNISVSTGGSTGVNGLNGTTNIGLGGTLTGNTTINGAGFQLNIGTVPSPLTTLRLNGEMIQMEAMTPRHTNDQTKIVFMVMDTANNNTIRTIPYASIPGEGRVLRGKFTCTYDEMTLTYNVSWYVIKNTTGIEFSLYRVGNGIYRVCDNAVNTGQEEQYGDCTWYGGVMFEPYKYGAELYGQIYNHDKHNAEIKIMDGNGSVRPEVNNASFEIRFYADGTCPNGSTSEPN
jgi:hypothetical protein